MTAKRLPSFSRERLLERYKSHIGLSFLDPKPNETIPKLHDRKQTYQQYADTKGAVTFYLTNVRTILDDLYVTGVLPNGATIGLKVENVHPWFYMSVQPAFLGGPPPPGADTQLFRRLNKKKLWPAHLVHMGENQNPVTVVEVVGMPNAVEYRGVDPSTGQRRLESVYRLSFRNMSCWKHYRDLLRPLRSFEKQPQDDGPTYNHNTNKADLDWLPQLYHERNSFTLPQMFFNLTDLSPCMWVEVDASVVDWTPLDTPDPFGGFSDTEWTEQQLLEQQAAARSEYKNFENLLDDDDDDDDDNEEEEDGGERRKKKKRLSTEEWKKRKMVRKAKKEAQQLKWNARHRSRELRTVLEGRVDFKHLRPRSDMEGAGPICEVTVDIETASGRVVRHTLQRGVLPPTPDDEPGLVRGRKPMDSIDKFAALVDRAGWVQDPDTALSEIARDLIQRLPASLQAQEPETLVAEQEVKPKNVATTPFEKRHFGGSKGKKRKREMEEAAERCNLNHFFKCQGTASKKQPVSTPAVKTSSKPEVKSGGVDFKPMHLYPDPNQLDDPITYIATQFWIFGDDRPFLDTMHSLMPATERKEMKETVKFRWSSPSLENEHAMLSHWTHMVCSQMDTEFLWQYNGIGYDLPYMFIRAKRLECKRFFRLGRFLKIPREEFFHPRRYRECEPVVIAKPGRGPYRRDFNGNAREGVFDFPGITVDFPGLLQPDAYRTIRQMTFNTLEFGTLKEVTKRFTKCRCMGWRVEGATDRCAVCDHVWGEHAVPEACHGDTTPCVGCKKFEKGGSQKGKCRGCGHTLAAHYSRTKAGPCHCEEGPRKRDLRGVMLTPFFCSNDDYRAVEEFYCKEDVTSTSEVRHQQKMTPLTTELAALTRTDINTLNKGGQTIKTWNQVVHTAHKEKRLLDEKRRQYMQSRYGIPCETVAPYAKTGPEKALELEADARKTKAERQKERLKYTGGYVKNPKPGVVLEPINTLDWNSLYPSIAIAHHLCWSTWVDHQYDDRGRLWFPLYGKSFDDQDTSKYVLWRLQDLKPSLKEVGTRDLILVVEDWNCMEAARWIAYSHWQKMSQRWPCQPPHGVPSDWKRPAPPQPFVPKPGQIPKTFCFVQNRDSMFPPILERLLDGRTAVKKLMKGTKDEFLLGVYNAKQLALKASANSSYGFTGVVKGRFGGLPIACAICLLGRHWEIVSSYTSTYEFGSPDLYGDTDSIFVHTPFLSKRFQTTNYKDTKTVGELLKNAWAALSRGEIRAYEMPKDEKQNAVWGTDFWSWHDKYEQLQKSPEDVKKHCGGGDLDRVAKVAAWYKMKKQQYKEIEGGSGNVQDFLEDVCETAVLDQGMVCARTISERLQKMLDNRDAAGKLKKTMNLELEKQAKRVLFFRRKMYAFHFSWPPDERGKIKMQGIGKRRDMFPMLRKCYEKVIELQLLADAEVIRCASASFVHPRFQPPKKKKVAAPKKKSAEAKQEAEAAPAEYCMSYEQFDQMWADEQTSAAHAEKHGKSEKEEKRVTEKPQAITPSFPVEELQRIEFSQIQNAVQALLKPFDETAEKLLSKSLSYEEVQVTCGVSAGHVNENSRSLHAIREVERVQNRKLEEGQRIAYVIEQPPRSELKITRGMPAYPFQKLYRYSIETSMAEEKGAKLFRMYYFWASLVKKICQAVCVVFPPTVVKMHATPYARRILQEDMGWKDLRLSLTQPKAAAAKASAVASHDELDDCFDDPNRLPDDEDDE